MNQLMNEPIIVLLPKNLFDASRQLWSDAVSWYHSDSVPATIGTA